MRTLRGSWGRTPFGMGFLLLAYSVWLAAPAAAITPRGAGVTAQYGSATTITVGTPSGAQAGDVLLATLSFGGASKKQPVLTAPAGWTLVTRTNDGTTSAQAVFRHVLAAGDGPATWTAGTPVSGTAIVTAYGGVDGSAPVDVSGGRTTGKRTAAISTPSLTTTVSGAMLVASFSGVKAGASGVTWTPPAGMTEAADVAAEERSASVASAAQAAAGTTGQRTATASREQDGGIATLTALRPAQQPPPPPPPGAVPLIVDTDIFSDADDVGGLATAFGHQLGGEAKLLAVLVNTRTSRPAVAADSWNCVAAIDDFYGARGIPIGTSLPNDGTDVNVVDFAGPCADLAPAGLPVPESAVTVYRRTLAAQPDASVVIVSTGYLGNLSALLDSPGDAASPLSGRDLVARKVRMLVAMAGGYPSRSGETNLSGDPASAQNVAASWPTKLVWCGYEVGDAVHTGQTVSTAHPASSPVRVAYEAFVAPGNWIYSYDLTAVYHAVRPTDPQLTEVGPGTNVIDSSGGNRFVSGAGDQWYVKLGSASLLAASIEQLLDTIPPQGPADTTPPTIGGVGAGSVTSSAATVSWTTDEPASSQVDYGTTTAYGASTTLDGTLVSNHSQALSGLSPSTVYHYRVRSTDAAGNTAVSGDATFATAAGDPPPPAAGPSDTFDSGVLDPAKWVVSSSGSAAGVVSQELQITHPAGAWTKATVTSAAPHDQTGRALQLQLKRAANGGQGGSTYGETSIFLSVDATRYLELFVAGGSVTAWVNKGAGDVNLTPAWPRYDATAMQWLRFRESGGTVFFEYAAGATSPGTWTTLASVAKPFPLDAVRLQLAAGSNVAATDTARFDNVLTG